MVAPLRKPASSDREAEACWREIKSESGFSTYAEYLGLYKSLDDPQHARLKSYLEDNNIWGPFSRVSCLFVDIFLDETVSSFVVAGNEHKELSTNILRCLRNPPPRTIARILLLDRAFKTYEILHPSIADAIGLCLKISPDVFEAYLGRDPHMDYSRRIPLGSQYGATPNAVFTLVRDYLSNTSQCPPVLLMMGHSFLDDIDMWYGKQPVSFLSTSIPLNRHELASQKHGEWFVNSFEQSLHDHRTHFPVARLGTNVIMIHALLPLLRMQFRGLKAVYDNACDRYLALLRDFRRRNEAMKLDQVRMNRDLEEIRFSIRRHVHESEQCMNDFVRYFRAQRITNLKGYEAYVAIMDEANACLQDARGLEAELRDWLQLQVGSLALEESKKSIQLSNLQIKDSKRVQLVTILAFLYVPLNLATSIFGMNLQQLNQNGQQIWVFIITAVVSLMFTTFVWLCTARCLEYIQWRHQMRAYNRTAPGHWQEKGAQGYGFVIRLALLIDLLRKGYAHWTWTTNAWILIVTNEPPRVRRVFKAEVRHLPRTPGYEGNLGNVIAEEYDKLTVCDYVCKHLDEHPSYFDPYHFKAQSIKSDSGEPVNS